MLLTLIVFIIILSLLVFVHELGHFLTAKRNGIKVEEFAFGFPPRIWAIKRGETEYAINLLPFGGYVKMLGEEEDATAAEKKNSRSYAHQSAWVRSKVIVAGVLMNLVLAWALLTIGFWIGMGPLASQPDTIPFARQTKAVAIAAVGQGTAAESMGLKPGDHVLKLNGQEVTSPEQLSALTQENKGKEVTLEVRRQGDVQTLTGTLGTGEGPLGVRPVTDVTVKLPFWWAPIFAIWETIKATGLVFMGIVEFFRQLFTEQSIPAEAAGPVGIFYYTRSMLELGFSALLNFVAVLSINLAVINILPVPALDGGRLLFIILEKFNRGKKVLNQQIENIAHLVGFILLMILIVSITYNDIVNLVR